MRKITTLLPWYTLAIAGCMNTSGSTTQSCSAVTQTAATPSADWKGSVFTIVMENHSKGQIFGNSDAPFINQIASQNAIASGYHDSYVHPSEPNYIWMVSGENFGILNDNDPGAGNHIAATSHIADQLEGAGLTWKTYQESMGTECTLYSHDLYASKHNPFVYFDDINGWDGKQLNSTPRCREHVVDYSQLDADIAAGTLPKYAFITPNLQDDMHDGSIAQGDAWLAREIPKILGTKEFNDGGAIFLLWDEGGGLIPGDDPPMIVISPHAKPGFQSQTSYDTSSYLKTVEQILGLQELPCAQNSASVQPMTDLFSVPLTRAATAPPPPAKQ
jgi:phospholipase C